mmetsp:Transcript_39514/g.66370  ORF Transcript_39514/g.66370 Transcript_39514/m.66370 type:complete len:264 (+) Transcript_39514:1014-1805(+)
MPTFVRRMWHRMGPFAGPACKRKTRISEVSTVRGTTGSRWLPIPPVGLVAGSYTSRRPCFDKESFTSCAPVSSSYSSFLPSSAELRPPILKLSRPIAAGGRLSALPGRLGLAEPGRPAALPGRALLLTTAPLIMLRSLRFSAASFFCCSNRCFCASCGLLGALAASPGSSPSSSLNKSLVYTVTPPVEETDALSVPQLRAETGRTGMLAVPGLPAGAPLPPRYTCRSAPARGWGACLPPYSKPSPSFLSVKTSSDINILPCIR